MRMKCLIAILTVALGTTAMAAKRWNGPANLNDTGTGIAADMAGNSFTVGTTDSGGGPGKNVLIVARDPIGAVAWQRQFDLGLGLDEIGKKVVLDGFGNLFVLAEFDEPATGKNILVLKYTVAGNFMGSIVFNGPFNLDDTPTDMEYDATNFVVVTGSVMTPAGSTDALIVRIMDNLSGFAFRLVNGPANGNDVFNAVAVDAGGNMYVTGTVWAGFKRYDVAFLKYAPNFIQLGARSFNGIVGGDDRGIDITLSPAGFVMIAGTTYNGPVNKDDILALKFFRTGGGYLQTFYNRGGGSDDRSVAITYAPGDSPVIVGTTEAGTTDMSVVKFSNALGAPQWVRHFNGTGNGADVPNSVACDGINIYVAGNSLGAGTDFDSETLAYNLFGALVWSNRYDFAALVDTGSQVVANPMGVFVSGTSDGTTATNLDQTATRLNPLSGAMAW